MNPKLIAIANTLRKVGIWAKRGGVEEGFVVCLGFVKRNGRAQTIFFTSKWESDEQIEQLRAIVTNTGESYQKKLKSGEQEEAID